MELTQEIWDMQAGAQEPGPQRDISVMNQPECSICYSTYDNVFKTPKELDCKHTFCLECLSRIMALSLADQDSSHPPNHISCPFCRRTTMLPQEGPPALTTNLEVLRKLPHHQQHEEPVWLEGEKLCYKNTGPDSPAPLCVCINIGGSETAAVPSQPSWGSRWYMEARNQWRFFILLLLLLSFFIFVVMQCVFVPGNSFCQRSSNPVSTIATTSAGLHQRIHAMFS